MYSDGSFTTQYTLMKDQVAAFTSVGMTEVFVNDESASWEQKRKITHGECQLVFISF